MDFHNHSKVPHLLIAGVIITFVIVAIVAWPRFRQALPESTSNQPTETLPPERTPAEIISGYNAELQTVSESLDSTIFKAQASSHSNAMPAAVTEASKLLNDFFFSARVPDAARDAHLKAALEFKNIDPKKTDDQKLTAWQEIIKKLQTAVAAV